MIITLAKDAVKIINSKMHDKLLRNSSKKGRFKTYTWKFFDSISTFVNITGITISGLLIGMKEE